MDANVKNLLKRIEELKSREVGAVVRARMSEFEKVSDKFSELCFCILTANSTAERCISVQERIGAGFLSFSFDKLVSELKRCGCRFHTKRAGYIIEARGVWNELNGILKDNGISEFGLREWIVKNVKGIGMKEASHFLRNIGFKDLAIVDFHIVDLLVGEGLIERPKSLSVKKYLEIEEVLREISLKARVSLGGLDLYLWYLETGKVLK